MATYLTPKLLWREPPGSYRTEIASPCAPWIWSTDFHEATVKLANWGWPVTPKDMGLRELVFFLMMSTEEGAIAMSYPANLPAPNQPQEDWLAGMSVMDEPVNMRHYRDASGSDRRLWLIEASRRFTEGMRAKVLTVKLTPIESERVNCYAMAEDAKIFWQNGREEGLSNTDILNGWIAMMSVMDDTKSDKE